MPRLKDPVWLYSRYNLNGTTTPATFVQLGYCEDAFLRDLPTVAVTPPGGKASMVIDADAIATGLQDGSGPRLFGQYMIWVGVRNGHQAYILYDRNLERPELLVLPGGMVSLAASRVLMSYQVQPGSIAYFLSEALSVASYGTLGLEPPPTSILPYPGDHVQGLGRNRWFNQVGLYVGANHDVVRLRGVTSKGTLANSELSVPYHCLPHLIARLQAIHQDYEDKHAKQAADPESRILKIAADCRLDTPPG